MGFIQDFFKRNKEKKEQLSNLINEMRIKKQAEYRMKSANERELDRFHDEAKQKQVKEQLEQFRKQKNDDMWNKDMISQKNMFNSDENILRQKNLFGMHGGMFLK